MDDEQDKNRAFGKEEGLARRLAMWANTFSRDGSYPWVGLGFIDDVKCAARMLGDGEDPNDLYSDQIYTKPVTQFAAPVQEYDL